MKRFIALASAASVCGSGWALEIFNVGFEASEGYSLGPIEGQQGWYSFWAPQLWKVSEERSLTGLRSLRAGVEIWGSNDHLGRDILPEFSLENYPSTPVLVAEVDYYLRSWDAEAWIGLTPLGDDLSRWVAGLEIRRNMVKFYDGSAWRQREYLGIEPDAWYHLEVRLDMAARTSSMRLNGALIGVGTLFYPDVNMVSINRQGIPSTIYDPLGYLDNYHVYAVPEPAALAAFALGLLCLKKRR